MKWGPYLLFTGILMEGMEKFVGDLQLSDDQEFVICDYLRGHPNLVHLLKERVEEAVKTERFLVSNETVQ
ncbi:hypothetical protein [Halobacillus seohaensis]|uniref:Uncharacterized protein n=1 Tax=Halobacillus seohaensis TaxID=447421 RepID=A0ABW2EMU8_9BACI